MKRSPLNMYDPEFTVLPAAGKNPKQTSSLLTISCPSFAAFIDSHNHLTNFILLFPRSAVLADDRTRIRTSILILSIYLNLCNYNTEPPCIHARNDHASDIGNRGSGTPEIGTPSRATPSYTA